MEVFHRAIRQDLRRLGACLGELAGGGARAARADAVCRYTTALLTAIRARQDCEDAILWPVTAAVAGQSVDLVPLADDHQAIGDAAGKVSTALGRLAAEPGALGELRASVALLADMLDEHIADQEAQVVPAMRRYLTVGACLWCEKQIWRGVPLRDRMFTVPWLARHAKPEELARLLTPGGWTARLLLAAARPGYRRLERRAFGSGNPRTGNPGSSKAKARRRGRNKRASKEEVMSIAQSAAGRPVSGGLPPNGPAGASARAVALVSTQGGVNGTRPPRRATCRPAIEIAHLRKTYGALVAVDDVSFWVTEGEIFGILGPNGAGKTTTVECAIGLRSPDSGTIRLMGVDPRADQARIHEIIGVQLQSGASPAKLRVGEILDMYQSFYRHPADVGELAGALGLADKRKAYYRSLSGGQQQRLSVVLALIGAPKLAVLDEMTTGLDPHARRDAWELIRRARDRGTTILLVTHLMEEAERLCDRVALIDSGRVVALDTPAGLAARATGGTTIRFLPSAPFDQSLLTRLSEVTAIEHDGHQVVVTGTGELATAVIVALHSAGVEARDVRIGASTLEDTFVRLTRRHLHEVEEGEQP